MARRPHIVYVCADRGVPVGGHKGASAHVEELTRALVKEGAEVRILAARSAVAEKGFPAPVVDVGGDRPARLARRALMDRASGVREEAAAAEAYALMLNQGLGRELDKLHRRWGIDAIYERYSLWGFAAAGFARAAGVPHLLEVNAPLRHEQRRFRSLINPTLAATIEAYLFSGVDWVLVPAAELRPYVIAQGARVSRVRVIPNAADPARYARRLHPARSPIGADDDFVVGFLGTLKPWHGLDDLVRVFRHLHRRHAGYRLLIAGDGPARPEMEQALRVHGLLGATTFAGALAHGEVPAWLARMQVGIAPYPPAAGFYFSPLKLFEYMAAGIPIVASDIGQISKLLTHRRHALLHRPGRIREMVAAVEELRASPRLAARLSRNAHSLLRRRFTWRHNAERVLALIESATRTRVGQSRARAFSGGRRAT